MMEYYENIHLELDTELEFGKYQGETVDDVLDKDPDYIEWLADQGVSMSAEILNEINK